MKYVPVIGLEIHCEVKSNSKAFSRGKNEFNNAPNVNVVSTDIALPGVLPVINMEVIKKSIMMALCLNCKIPEILQYDRKNYYYPDLPKGYQITQSHIPIGTNGRVTINVNGREKDILIHDIHMEEDTASLDHFDSYTLINYNRAGVPLIEMVTEPCIYSASEAVTFLEYLRNVLKYADISEADSKKGQIRCDVNISMKEEGSKVLGTRVEIKNINSFNNVRDAIYHEIDRQRNLLEHGRGDEIVQETRRFDELSGTTIHMRTKTDSVDYKYFIEPNIPRIVIEKELIEEIRKEIPLLPHERRKLYIKEYDLSEYDADILIRDKDISDYYHDCIRELIEPKAACNYLTSVICGYLNKELVSVKDIYLTPKMLKAIYDKQTDNTISSKQAKELIMDALENKNDPTKALESGKFNQVSDETELENIIKNILANNQDNIDAYHNGRTNLFDFFVGQVMKETKGKANPVVTKEILTKLLENN